MGIECRRRRYSVDEESAERVCARSEWSNRGFCAVQDPALVMAKHVEPGMVREARRKSAGRA
jgi:hypothetical protein